MEIDRTSPLLSDMTALRRPLTFHVIKVGGEDRVELELEEVAACVEGEGRPLRVGLEDGGGREARAACSLDLC